MTEITKHTPGPWRYLRHDNIITADHATKRILDFQPRSLDVPEAERDANGHLVAAAPDMLEALRWALPLASLALETHRLERLRCGHHDIGAGTDHVGLWPHEVAQREAARAALLKAAPVAETGG